METPTRRTWGMMITRCENSKYTYYHNYGGRGISVCERWHKFENFLEDMGERPEGTTLDRINNDGNYEKGNCRWSTIKEQNRNKRDTIYVTIYGIKKSVVEWAEELSISDAVLRERVKMGWSEDSLLKPVQQCKTITYKDKTQTIEEWAKEFNISLTTMHSRLKYGWTMERIEETRPRKTGKDKLIEFNNESKTPLEWAKTYGLTPTIVSARLRIGWSIEDAITTPVREKK